MSNWDRQWDDWKATYDEWKLRSPDDDSPPWDDDDQEGQEYHEEAELVIYDAEQAFGVLIDWHGFERAKEIMLTIIRNKEQSR